MPPVEEELQSDGTDDDWMPTAGECDGGQDEDFAKDGQITFEQLQGVELSACDGDGNPLGPANPERGLYKVAASFAKRGCDVTEESWKPADMSIFESFMKPPESGVNNSNGAPYTTLVLPVALDEADPASVASLRCATIYELSDQTTQYFYLWPAAQELALLQGCVEEEATDKELIEAGRRTGKGVAGLRECARQKLAAWQRPQYSDFSLSPFAYAALTKKVPLKRKPPAKKPVPGNGEESVVPKSGPKSAQRSVPKCTKLSGKTAPKSVPKTAAKLVGKADPKPGKVAPKTTLKTTVVRQSKSAVKHASSKQVAARPVVPNPAPPAGPPPDGESITPSKLPMRQVTKVPATPRKQATQATADVKHAPARRVLNVDADPVVKRKVPDEFCVAESNSTWKVLFELVKDGRRTYQLMEGSGNAPNSVSRAMETLSTAIS